MKRVQVFFDGGSRPYPNGGYAKCYGWVLKAGGETISQGRAIEIGDVDVGSCAVEFEALARALQVAANHAGDAEHIDVHGDSRAVIEMCAGLSIPHSDEMAANRERIARLASPLGSLRFVWIPREQNNEADRLGRIAFAEASRQDDRINMMNKVNNLARRKFGNFYGKLVMSEWCVSVTGKNKLSHMSVGELGKLLGHVRHIPNFVRDYVARCNTAAQTVSVCS